MNPELKKRELFSVLGVQSQIGHNSETASVFEEIWKKFEAEVDKIEPLSIEKNYFGIRFPCHDDGTEYLAGMAVPPDTSVPEGFVIRTVPEGEFAVVEVSIGDIGKTYGIVFNDWLPKSKVVHDSNRPVCEEYLANSFPERVRLCIPVKEKK